jgi:hypothetical protein
VNASEALLISSRVTILLMFYEHRQDLKYLFSEEDLVVRTGIVGTGIIRIGHLNRSQFASAQVKLKGSEPNSP